MSNFLRAAESLWAKWLQGQSRLPAGLAQYFDPRACPEPYLDFCAGSRPLVIVTTNPGRPMPHQSREEIVGGGSPARVDMAYRDVAKELAEFYSERLEGPAGRRIRAQRELSHAACYHGVIQVECFPWHSASLPSKAEILRFLDADSSLSEYHQHLMSFVADRPAVAVSAVSSRASLDGGRAELSPWLAWKAALIGIDPKTARLVPLVRNEYRTTCAALVARARNAPKALVLMMGSNNLPGSPGRARLAKALRETV